VRGEEELAVMTVPLDAPVMKFSPAASLPRASERMEKYRVMEQRSLAADRSPRFPQDLQIEELAKEKKSERLFEPSASYSSEPEYDPWHTIFTSGPVRIQFRGQHLPNAHQRQQLEAAARLIELALK
jgi:hypothetical protein